jgi:hypothetical protein
VNTDSNPDQTEHRHARRLAVLEARVDELDAAARRARSLGPILLLVLANVTPLIVATPRNDPGEGFTLFQVLRGALDGGGPASLWFVLVTIAGLASAVAAARLGGAAPSRGTRWFAQGVAAVLLVGLLVVTILAASAGSRSASFTAVSPAAVLAAAAAVWLIIGARSTRP